MLKTKDTKHGRLTYFSADRYVGRALDRFGEYSDGEVKLFGAILSPGDVAINAGANIGALAVPMARLVGPSGTVHAFEPQPAAHNALERNLAENRLDWVVAHQSAVGAEPSVARIKVFDYTIEGNFGAASLSDDGVDVPSVTIDSLNLERLTLLQADVEGAELSVLKGAAQTIARCKPALYVECDRMWTLRPLMDYLDSIGYQAWWHVPPLIGNTNYFGNKETDTLHQIVSLNLLCLPKESNVSIVGLVQAKADDFDEDIAIWGKTEDGKPLINRAENLCEDEQIYYRAVIHLLKGELRAGFHLYEDRWRTEFFKPHVRKFDVPQWRGEPLDGKTILVWHEQGYGDSICMHRYLPLLEKMAKQVHLHLPGPLHALFEHNTEQRYELGVPQGCDYHCPTMSLPFAFGTDRETVPDVCMVSPPGGRQLSGDFKVGIAWSGNPDHPLNVHRSIAVEQLLQVFDGSTSVYSLQQHLLDGDAGKLLKYGACMVMHEDIAQLAQSIMQMDLVISVDTVLANLALSLGKPTWVLLSSIPDWRWGTRGSSLWYPKARLFRQEKLDDWTPALERIRSELGALIDNENKQNAVA